LGSIFASLSPRFAAVSFNGWSIASTIASIFSDGILAPFKMFTAGAASDVGAELELCTDINYSTVADLALNPFCTPITGNAYVVSWDGSDDAGNLPDEGSYNGCGYQTEFLGANLLAPKVKSVECYMTQGAYYYLDKIEESTGGCGINKVSKVVVGYGNPPSDRHIVCTDDEGKPTGTYDINYYIIRIDYRYFKGVQISSSDEDASHAETFRGSYWMPDFDNPVVNLMDVTTSGGEFNDSLLSEKTNIVGIGTSPYNNYRVMCVNRNFAEYPLGYYTEEGLFDDLFNNIGLTIATIDDTLSSDEETGEDSEVTKKIKKMEAQKKEAFYQEYDPLFCVQNDELGTDSTKIGKTDKSGDIIVDNPNYFMNFEMYRRILGGMQGVQ
jgi:hypothetical protein